MGKRKTLDEFIIDAKKVHGDKFDYSLVKYKQSHIYVEIICPIHGVFKQTPSTHLKGRGCKKCGIIETKKKISKSTFKFINNAKKIHNNKFDYSLVKYINMETKIKIICPIHGVFEQRADSHLKTSGCPKCSYDNQRKTHSDFINKSNEVHNNTYDYTLIDYVNSSTKINIICPIHGIFSQNPNNHISKKYGCPLCRESKGEKEVKRILDLNNINYIREKKFNDCKYIKELKFDFYLPEKNICIEYDGKQHFQPIKYWGGEKELKKIQKRDKIKSDYCKKNNINFLRIKYNEMIQDKLQKNNII